MKTLQPPPRLLPKSFSRAYLRLLPNIDILDQEDKKFHLNLFIKHNQSKKTIQPFSRLYKLVELGRLHILLIVWAIALLLVQFFFIPKKDTLFNLSTILPILLSFSVLFTVLPYGVFSSLRLFMSFLVRNKSNLGLLKDGIGTQATYVGLSEGSIAHSIFGYFSEDGTYQTLKVPLDAVPGNNLSIYDLEPGDQTLLLYAPNKPSEGILYDLIPFAPDIDITNGQFIDPDISKLDYHAQSLKWLISYAFTVILFVALAFFSIVIIPKFIFTIITNFSFSTMDPEYLGMGNGCHLLGNFCSAFHGSWDLLYLG